ncbi:hypothetical protein CCZ01_04205 [Helicobacter monodelphidis]|nr:hypothetical protein CCZ01_04205 [Helicobacter sp. 15-1451]
MIAMVSLGLEYRAFLSFKTSGFKEGFSVIEASVLNQYTKVGKNGEYSVLRLQNKHISFYTTTKEDIKNLMHRRVRVVLVTKNLTFLQYLQGFYAFSVDIAVLPQEYHFKQQIRESITKQHTSEIAANVYHTLFLADSLNYQMRSLANALGIAHLFAISGYHYGVLSFFILLLSYPTYRYFHHHYFPYRNALMDLLSIPVIFGFLYLLLLGFTPSFLRAFCMALCSYLLFIGGVRVVSLHSFFALGLLMIALFPSLLFSIGFILSMLGVFYILLFIQYIPTISIWNIILFNLGIFLFMLIPVHFIFTPFTPLALLSIPLTLAFNFFYPFVLIAHLIGIGDVADSLILWASALEIPVIAVKTTKVILGIWIFLCFAAIPFRRLFYALNLYCLAFFSYNLSLFLLQ